MRVRRPAHNTVVAYTALVLAMGGSAYAATGGSLILGHKNSAGATTKLTNNGTGPALSLASQSGGPALAVSNHRLVKNLNANFLGGHASTYFQKRIRHLTFHPVTLENGWAAESFCRAPAYAVSREGIVYFRGCMHRTSAGGNPIAFNLPANAHPSTSVQVPVTESTSGSGGDETSTTGMLYVDISGYVLPVSDIDHAGSASTITWLDGASFALD